MGSTNAATASEHHSPSVRKDPITREQLYELVWSNPMLRVAERFGVSSSYMARVCSELQVPRPNRGYWTQHELGRPPTRPALPPLQPGDLESWTPGQSVGSNQRVALLNATPADVRVPAASRRGRPSKKASLPGIHPLLKGAKEHFLKSRDSRTGLAHPTKRLLVDIVVSPELLDQALDVANELFLALTAKGHRLVLPPLQLNLYRPKIPIREAAAPNRYYDEPWAPDRPTLLFIGDQCIGLTLFETLELVETVYSSGKYIAVRDLTPQQRRLMLLSGQTGVLNKGMQDLVSLLLVTIGCQISLLIGKPEEGDLYLQACRTRANRLPRTHWARALHWWAELECARVAGEHRSERSARNAMRLAAHKGEHQPLYLLSQISDVAPGRP